MYGRDAGVNAIESLMERQGAFDYILLETSGLADPGNIAPLFWVDDGLGSTIYLDGIVTVVDAKNIIRSLEEPVEDEGIDDVVDKNGHCSQKLTTAHVQISHADIILVNKADTVSANHLNLVKQRIRSINSLAKVETTEYGKVPHLEGRLLDLHAYDNVSQLDTLPSHSSHIDPVCPLYSAEQSKTLKS